MQKTIEVEEKLLDRLIAMEDLAEKKTKIYARLLIEPALAKEMDKFSMNHKKRKTKLSSLLYKPSKKEEGGEESEA